MAGRPKKIQSNDLDIAQASVFGKLGATQQEMADHFGCDVRTIEREMASDSAFCRAYKKAFSELKQSLRRQQIILADQGNPTMQVWLGKQLLGQSDKQEAKLEHTGKGGKELNAPVFNVSFPSSADK